MKRRLFATVTGSVWLSCAIAPLALAADADPHPRAFSLITAGHSTAAIVRGTDADEIERTALDKLQAALRRDGGEVVTLPVAEKPGPDAPAHVFVGTARSNAEIARLASKHGLPLDDLGPEGFLLRTLQDGDRPCLVIAGGGSRGVLYGIQEAIDQVLTCTPAGEVYVTQCDLTARPALSARGTYCLTCWGGAPRYDRAGWEAAIDSMADAGMNRVMFWMDGLFRSERHPGAFLSQKGQHYAGVKLTTEDIHQLARFAHQRGMEFFLGSGVFGWFTADGYIAKQFKDTVATPASGLCPSSPLAQKVTHEYLSEMIEVFPEADGYMLEIRDEMNDCLCKTCQRPLDAGGSKQFGQSELDFLEKLTAAVWKGHPKTKFIWLMGYSNHDKDALYYGRMRAIGRDPRMEWLDVRMSWTLPSADGQRKPLRELSDRAYHWDAYYKLPPENMQAGVRQIVKAGLRGYLPAYEPGFANMSVYDTQSETPFPVHLVPFCLTQFYYRTFTWNPQIPPKELLQRAHRKFFSAEVPPQLADDLLFMRRFMMDHYRELNNLIGRGLGPDGSGLLATVEDIWTVNRKGGDERKKHLFELVGADIRSFAAIIHGTGDMARVLQIEKRVAQYRPTASRRSRASLDLIQRAIDDFRTKLAGCTEYRAEVDEALRRLDDYVKQIDARRAASAPP